MIAQFCINILSSYFLRQFANYLYDRLLDDFQISVLEIVRKFQLFRIQSRNYPIFQHSRLQNERFSTVQFSIVRIFRYFNISTFRILLFQAPTIVPESLHSELYQMMMDEYLACSQSSIRQALIPYVASITPTDYKTFQRSHQIAAAMKSTCDFLQEVQDYVSYTMLCSRNRL